jgi:hypothetical protein
LSGSPERGGPRLLSGKTGVLHHAVHSGRRWYRLDLLELLVRAKAASERQMVKHGSRPTVN